MELKIFYLTDKLRNFTVKDNRRHPLVDKIQQHLAQRGLYTEKIHGLWDDATKNAVCKFQELEHLPVTGFPDPITYCRLQQYDKLIQLTSWKAKPRISSALPQANILITRTNRQLTLLNSATPIREFPVAIGKPSTPTPLGNFAIATKIVNPGGVLGSRWMGLNYDTYGIHGTNKPWLIGQQVSHGCIRMHNADAEELFNLIRVGTPVRIRD